jgi:hypothetical protein
MRRERIESDVFLLESIPAAGRQADDVYLAEVDRCALHLASLGNDYGYEDREGVSPTEREFDRATARKARTAKNIGFLTVFLTL